MREFLTEFLWGFLGGCVNYLLLYYQYWRFSMVGTGTMSSERALMSPNNGFTLC